MARRNGPRSIPITTALLALLTLSVLTPTATAQDQSTWLVDVGVDASVCDGYAIVEVTAHIRNRGPDPEFPFVVQVPDGAFVTNLTIVRDGQAHYGTIADREEARAAYEEHKAAEQTGGLVEKQRGSQAFSYLINVAEFEEVFATLRYEQYVSAVRGVVDLAMEAPVSGFGQDMGARFDVALCPQEAESAWTDPGTELTSGGDGTVHAHHAVGPRPDDDATPFSLHYTRTATTAGGAVAAMVQDGEGYFAHRFQAEPDPDRLPADIVLVLDTSGSMNGDKILQLQDAARQLVASLGAEDRLHLAFFSSTVQSPWDGLRAMDGDGRSAAIEAIDAAFAGGGTNIEAGLERAYDALGDASDPERTPLVMLLSDGQASVGAVMHERVVERASEGVRLFSIAFGADADWSLLYGLAEEGQGVAEHVETGAGAEVDIQRFLEAWTTPVLRDLDIEYAEGIEALVQDVDILFSGSELLVAGTFDAGQDAIAGTVRADSADGPVEAPFSVPVAEATDHPSLARLVVFRQIEALEDRYAAGDTSAEEPLRALALEHSFVTDLTSLVLLLPESGDTEWTQTTTATSTSTAASGSSSLVGTTASTATSTRTSTTSWSPVSTGTSTGIADQAEGDERSTPGPGVTGAAAALAMAFLARRRR